MSRYQLRLVGVTVAAVVLLTLTTFVLDWFTIDLLGTVVRINIHSVSLCAGPCSTHSLSEFGSVYSWMANLTFWGAILLLFIVIAHGVMRVLTGGPSEWLARVGVWLAISVISTGFIAGYIVGPEAPSMGGLSLIEVKRTLAPIGLLLGALCAIVSLRLSESTSDDAGEYKPIIVARPGAPVRPSSGKLQIVSTTPGRAKPPTQPPPVQPQPPPDVVVSIRPRPASKAPPIRAATMPSHIRYATITAAFSGTGITATRQDGLTKLVKWESVVGIVARRLPPAIPYDSAPFVDIVSSSGSTLRILPATEITGHSVPGTGIERARALVQVLAVQCLDAKLDPATKTFSEGGVLAQLPDEKILAAHDERLA